MIGLVLPLLIATLKTQFSLDSKNGIVSGITEKNQNAVFTRSVKFKASDYDSDSFVSENKP